jgi:hypothetical protein
MFNRGSHYGSLTFLVETSRPHGLSLVKKFQILERLSGQFRFDAFNVFNHPVYAFSQNNGANGCIDCQGGNNGKITALESGTTMRQLQFAIRFDF